jgi:O-antigen/teichoic acid export membrane protein
MAEKSGVQFISNAVDADPVPSRAVAGTSGRLARSIAALFVNSSVAVVGQLALVPIALFYWGSAQYGEWLILTGLVSLLKFADLGLQTLVVNRLCESFALGKRDEMSRTLQSGVGLQSAVAVVLLAIACLTPILAQPTGLFSVGSNGGIELASILLFLSLEVLIGIPMGTVAGLYRATGRLPRAAAIGTFQQLMLVVASALLIGAQATFLTLAMARACIAVFVSTFILIDLVRLYPWIRPRRWIGSFGEATAMVPSGVLFVLIPLSETICNQSLLMISLTSLGSDAVSQLATHRTAVNAAVMMGTVMATAVWPELTALNALREQAQLRQLHHTLLRLNLWSLAAVTVGMLPILPLIYPSWTAGRLELDYWVLAFLIARTLVWGTWNVSMTLLLASSRQQRVAWALFGSAGLAAALAMVLVPWLGLPGAALALLAADLGIAAWVIPLSACRQIGERITRVWTVAGEVLLRAVVAPAGVGLLLWQAIPWLPLRYALVIPLAWGLAIALAWSQLSRHERDILMSAKCKLFSHLIPYSAKGSSS